MASVIIIITCNGTWLYRERIGNDVVSGFAVRGDQTCADAMRCARYYDDFAVSHFYPYLKPDLLWPTSMM
jgi:hypothetical protein